MNLRFVEAFYWAVSLKSVTRAAEKLFITQSALSSRIAALEEELGVLLLDRRDKQFRVTVVGTRFFGYAQRLLELQRQIKGELGSDSARAQLLRIGAIESVVHSWLTEWLQQMRVDHPAFELELTVETTPLLTEQVRRGTLDLVFAALPAGGEGIRTRALQPMEMVFVGHAVLHPRKRYALADLARFELLTFQRASQPYVALLDMFRSGGIEPPRVHAISSISAMVQLVEGGFGIATLPRVAAERLAQRQPLRVLNCTDALSPLPLHASYREDPTSTITLAALEAAAAFAGLKAPRRGAARTTPLSKKSMS
ncbi:LysR family transcriptional regulator [Aquincola sp. S2]|uniref:LysR family transcriptional regulator n=1 Tax=Pseudaquabacterium terrae TaxID=2732868 RepID=A0ABX2EPX6_9BURK|nr:LysR family transcriptional regulator [Aquabacterium terrae]NRF70668.1 LysR family transcriptional regulator [Aquabacterium terrae]